jgi:hypothetical protein
MIVDLAAVDRRIDSSSKLTIARTSRVFAWPRFPQQDQVVPGEDPALQARQHRFVEPDDPGNSSSPRSSLASRFARSSSFTVRSWISGVAERSRSSRPASPGQGIAAHRLRRTARGGVGGRWYGRYVDAEQILENLNEEQRQAARADPRTRSPSWPARAPARPPPSRIASPIRSPPDTFPADKILAVTFTEKAAGELKSRLAGLGVEGVDARTFHSAALSHLHKLWERSSGRPSRPCLDHKAPLISSLANALPAPHKFLPGASWPVRSNGRRTAWSLPRTTCRARARGHEPPIPPELMLRVYEGYERRKQTNGKIDFEDMLGLAVKMFDAYPEAAEAVRERFHAFTVDEFQDVNPLQSALLDRWLGDRDDLCVVGDDYQTIYSFTGASPDHLLGFTDRLPEATIVRLERNYRSTPEILGFANELAAHLGGFPQDARGDVASGPPVIARPDPRSWRKRSRRSCRPSTSCVPTTSRWNRSRSCTGSTLAPSPSKRRSPPRASRIRCATARSSAARGRSPCCNS